MNRLIFLLLTLLPALLQGATGGDTSSTGLLNPGYEEKPAWFKESFLDIREDVGEAVAGNKRVLLYFYQDGCPYCSKLLHDNFGDQRIAQKTRQHFDVIAINMWGDREVTGFSGESATEKTFSSGLRVQYTPSLLFLDEQGAPVVRLNGYYQPHYFSAILDYVAQHKEGELPLREYIATVTPQPASGKLHVEPGILTAPLDLSTIEGSKPLLVMFEQKQCLACDELHQDILQRPEVRKSLQGFQVAVLDMWSRDVVTTPVGINTTAREWAQKLGIQYAPSLLFFNSTGEEVFRSEGYLRAFHIHGVLDYVLSGAYKQYPEFQRFLQQRREDFEKRGLEIDLWK
ncbi:MAG: thioredoxin fold domain-containing protein [Pseudomonadota bacterium]